MSNKIIKKVRIEKLFGLYTYNFPATGDLSNAAILYGDNGVGKSTVLRLAFHLLSAANDRGHRTALFKAKFASLEIDLISGHTLAASFRYEGATKYLTLSIRLEEVTLVVWDHTPKPRQGEASASGDSYFMDRDKDGKFVMRRKKQAAHKKGVDAWGQAAYLETLREIVPATYILNADRRLDSDEVADPSDEIELRRLMRYEDVGNINDLLSRSREIALSQALLAASRWMSRKALQSANQGTENVHSVYGNVLKHLGGENNGISISMPQDVSGLIRQLTTIETKTAEFAEYELTTALSTADFRRSLNSRNSAKRELSANLLKPYIESLNSRLKAIDPIYVLINRFISTINSLLSDKSIIFKLSQGFSFQNRNGEQLESAHLSSGEQQLLLLFCNVLVARDNSSVFMIDEPEISLNIKWQRQLIRALLGIADESRVQFIFASHSIELLSQHRDRVVKLVNQE